MHVLRQEKPARREPAGRQQFEAFVLPQLDALYRMALHLTSSRQEAEDLVQETCLRAYTAFDRFDGQHGRAWLFTILRHTHISRWRHDGSGTCLVPYDEQADETSDSPFLVDQSAEDVALASVLAEDLERALAALPAEWRLILLLAYVEDMSYAEIAQVLDCPVGTVMSRLYRARHALEQQLTPTRANRARSN